MSLILTSIQSNLSFVDLPPRKITLSLEDLNNVMGGML